MLRRPFGRLRATKNPSRAKALYGVFSPPYFGQGSMLRIALLPAQNIIYLERYVQYFRQLDIADAFHGVWN